MKKYVYVVTDRNRASLHVGMSSDLMKTMKFYRDMPNLFFDNSQQLTRLIYFEELNSENIAIQRFELISHFTRTQKEKLVRNVNPDWIDLTIGLDFEHIVFKTMEKTQLLQAS
ncbi:GIY-YIG nuclease family protein [Pedobacter sp. HMF7647]|uniref:GIY-YIG nuclease family protein n=1 Tax=Hufsiella arboris TaxID=2695275 RepID=A0A7K1Y9C9_9SPHI|nr:GIY-YIG nuclease family protein [Hufsiella arboris]MXV50648.1 GIY-YIG nuclease family protein [Hufsiella arboris]